MKKTNKENSQMSITTNLQGRLKNTSLKKSHALFPLFEAVINSIHACEERKDIELSKCAIDIQIIRKTKTEEELSLIKNETTKPPLPEIIEFHITDNGIGFNDTNLDSFNTLDSEHKEKKGCKGIGRLLWLKAFEQVEISSQFKENNTFYCRHFHFTKETGITPELPEKKESFDHNFKTVVKLLNFKTSYREAARKTTSAIANDLLEHCLLYFFNNSCPVITIIDNEMNEEISLTDLFYEIKTNEVIQENFSCEKSNFKLYIVKTRKSIAHTIHYCAANRLVKKIDLSGKIDGLYKNLQDKNGKFSCLCFLSSPYLDEKVRQERTDFDIEEKSDPQHNLLGEPTIEDINKKIYSILENTFKDSIEQNKKLGQIRLQNFVKDNPKYKTILKYCSNLNIDPELKDKDIDLILYKEKIKLEDEIKKDNGNISSIPQKFSEQYTQNLNHYLSLIDDVSKSTLAEYISHRKIVIDFFEKAINSFKNEQSMDEYELEKIVHSLIMPLKTTHNETNFDTANLWLIDDNLTFYSYLSSDLPLNRCELIDTKESKRPDILGINFFDNPLLVNNTNEENLAAIKIIEIKRPMRDNYTTDDNPIDQVLDYLTKIRKGKIKDHRGRRVTSNINSPAFCYILADVEKTLKERAMRFGLTITEDQLGFFGFNANYNAYIEIIGFDKLLKIAKQRNKVFFDKLGL